MCSVSTHATITTVHYRKTLPLVVLNKKTWTASALFLVSILWLICLGACEITSRTDYIQWQRFSLRLFTYFSQWPGRDDCSLSLGGCFVGLAPVSLHPNKNSENHGDDMTWKHLPHYWCFVREIHRSPVDFPHKDQWCWSFAGVFVVDLNKVLKNNWVACEMSGNSCEVVIISTRWLFFSYMPYVYLYVLVFRVR